LWDKSTGTVALMLGTVRFGLVCVRAHVCVCVHVRMCMHVPVRVHVYVRCTCVQGM